MPSWIKQIDGIDWYDERYVQSRTKQNPSQLERKAETGKLKRFTDRQGGHWYPAPAVDELEEAYKRRVATAKKRRPSEKQLEARYEKQAKELRATARYGHPSAGSHADKVMIAEIFIKEAERKKAKGSQGD